MLCLLLICIRQAEKEAFGIGASRNLEPCRKISVDKAHRDGDGRKSGSGNESLRIIAAVLFIGAVKRGGRVAPAGKDKGINPGAVHCLYNGGQKCLPARMLRKVGAGLVSFCRMNDLRLFLRDCVQNAFYIRSILTGLQRFHHIAYRRIVSEREEILVHIIAKPVAPVTRLHELLLIFYFKVYNLGAQLTQISNSIIESGKDETVALRGVRVGAKYSETFA